MADDEKGSLGWEGPADYVSEVKSEPAGRGL